jgi:hypothetical protein
LKIQRRIADILSVYDDLIEVNTRRIAVLEEMVARIFKEMFGGDGEGGVRGTIGLMRAVNHGQCHQTSVFKGSMFSLTRQASEHWGGSPRR